MTRFITQKKFKISFKYSLRSIMPGLLQWSCFTTVGWYPSGALCTDRFLPFEWYIRHLINWMAESRFKKSRVRTGKHIWAKWKGKICGRTIPQLRSARGWHPTHLSLPESQRLPATHSYFYSHCHISQSRFSLNLSRVHSGHHSHSVEALSTKVTSREHRNHVKTIGHLINNMLKVLVQEVVTQ